MHFNSFPRGWCYDCFVASSRVSWHGQSAQSEENFLRKTWPLHTCLSPSGLCSAHQRGSDGSTHDAHCIDHAAGCQSRSQRMHAPDRCCSSVTAISTNGDQRVTSIARLVHGEAMLLQPAHMHIYTTVALGKVPLACDVLFAWALFLCLPTCLLLSLAPCPACCVVQALTRHMSAAAAATAPTPTDKQPSTSTSAAANPGHGGSQGAAAASQASAAPQASSSGAAAVAAGAATTQSGSGFYDEMALYRRSRYTQAYRQV